MGAIDVLDRRYRSVDTGFSGQELWTRWTGGTLRSLSSLWSTYYLVVVLVLVVVLGLVLVLLLILLLVPTDLQVPPK